MIYTHVLNRGPAAPRSPADRDVNAVIWLAALAPKHSGIGCRIKQPIPVQDALDNRAQVGERKRLGVETRARSRVGMGRKISQESRYYAGQPIWWPNCSSASSACD
jgi:hypothetical protein